MEEQNGLEELRLKLRTLERELDALKQSLRRGLLQVVRGLERSSSD